MKEKFPNPEEIQRRIDRQRGLESKQKKEAHLRKIYAEVQPKQHAGKAALQQEASRAAQSIQEAKEKNKKALQKAVGMSPAEYSALLGIKPRNPLS